MKRYVSRRYDRESPETWKAEHIEWQDKQIGSSTCPMYNGQPLVEGGGRSQVGLAGIIRPKVPEMPSQLRKGMDSDRAGSADPPGESTRNWKFIARHITSFIEDRGDSSEMRS
jgi:hypothetical protein